MKLCPTCQHCYEDTDASCAQEGHAGLVPSRPGPRLIADKYLLDRLLGRGGVGAVYAGTHVELGRPVAIKLLLPDFLTDQQALERFRREARAAARLNHSNVPDIYDYGTLPGGEAYLVMELVKGLTLRQYLRRRAPLPFADAIRIARQVANGVEAAHQGGIIHRDLKPSNIILTRTHIGRLHAKIVDSGLAVALVLGLGLLWLARPRTPSDPLTAQTTPTPSPTAQGDELVKRLPPAVVESAAKKVPKAPPRGQEQPSPTAVDKRPPAAVTGETAIGEKTAGGLPRAESEAERAHLRASLDEWIRATNAHDIRKQMAFYPRLVPAFYRWRNVSQQAVLAEKARLFGQAKVIDVRTGPPQITLSPDGNTATMRFRK